VGVFSSIPNTSKFAVLPNERRDPANDHVPVLAYANRDDRLNVEHVLITVKRTYAKVAVVLERYADEASHRVLGSFL
jgi:hypothetical protein